MAGEPSEYAQRYVVTNEPFLGDNKSGLTPTEDLVQPNTSKTLVHLDRILGYQASCLEGFKTQELDLAKTITGSGITRSDLQTIHPMLQWDRWETELPMHLGRQDSGLQAMTTYGTCWCYVWPSH